MESEIEKLELFKKWCDTRFVNINGHERMSLKDFDEIMTDSYNKLNHLTDTPDHLSFVCGIAAGMKFLLSQDNE